MKQLSLGDFNIHDFGNEIQIEGVLWSGKGRAFVTLVPQKALNIQGEDIDYLSLNLQEWEQLIKQVDLLETEIFEKDSSGITKKLVRKTQRQIDSYLQWTVFKRDNYTCRYCGRTGIPLTVDHVDLWENGGATIEENLITACRSCNKDRGRMEYADWLNSELYQRKSRGLTDEQRSANNEVLNHLDHLRDLRVKNIRSR